MRNDEEQEREISKRGDIYIWFHVSSRRCEQQQSGSHQFTSDGFVYYDNDLVTELKMIAKAIIDVFN